MARKQQMIEEDDVLDELEEAEFEAEPEPVGRRERQAREKGEEARRRPAGKKQEPARKSPKSQNKIIRYFQDTRDELRRVTWPSRQEALRLTLIVLGTTVAFAIFLGLLDFLFQRLAGLLI